MVIGGISGSANTTTFMNCYNKGNITGKEDYRSQYVGGIIGSVSGDTVIQNSYNLGNLSGLGTGDICVGGIYGQVGNSAGDYKANTLTIQNCYNLGSLEGLVVGGIGGSARSQSVHLRFGYNLSTNLIGTNILGGIFGYFSNDFTEVVHNVSNVYNVDNTFFGQSTPTGSTVSNTGLINTDGTFPNGTPYTDLLTALNAWVDANKATYPELKNWVMGSNGYPTFAE